MTNTVFTEFFDREYGDTEDPNGKLYTENRMQTSWRGWAACRDAEFVGEEAENDAFNGSNTLVLCLKADQGEAPAPAAQGVDSEGAPDCKSHTGRCVLSIPCIGRCFAKDDPPDPAAQLPKEGASNAR